MIKAVIFDLNGVFLESEYLSKRLSEKYGIDEDDFVKALKEVMAVVRKPGNDDAFSLWKPHLDRTGIPLDKDEFFDFWFSGEHIVNELIEYAKELRQNGLQVFILSNNFKERTTYYRQNFPEIFESVDYAYFSWETGFVKPDKQAYQNVLSKNDLKPEECVYFDDQNKCVEQAKSVGIHAFNFEGVESVKKHIINHQ